LDKLWVDVPSVERCASMYPLEVRGRTVLDIGAYLGETVLCFLKRGAVHVIARELLFYEYLLENLIINNLADLVEVKPIWAVD